MGSYFTEGEITRKGKYTMRMGIVHRKRGHRRRVKAEVEIRMPCEVYSRIVGYYRPIRNWHEGKRQEFRERRVYDVPVMA